MAEYITSADITSTVLIDFSLNNYITRANEHVEYIAETLGLTSADIALPIQSVLKEYAVNWCSRAIVLEKIGANNIEIATGDKYLILYNVYNDECERLRKYLTPELVKKTNTNPEELSPIVTIYRG